MDSNTVLFKKIFNITLAVLSGMFLIAFIIALHFQYSISFLHMLIGLLIYMLMMYFIIVSAENGDAYR